MKRTIRLSESELRNMISESVKKILKEAIDYRSVSDWNNELSNTDNLYDYDETLGNAKENLRMQGVNARLHHPATTPWSSDDPDDLSSMDSVDLLYAKPDELERIANKRKTKVYPSGLKESIRNSIKRVLKESRGYGGYNPNAVYIVFDGTSHYAVYGCDIEDEINMNDAEVVEGPFADWDDEVDNRVEELNNEANGAQYDRRSGNYY